MRFEITGQWKDGYEHDGILYCAQRMEEMLMNYTSHLYKVPVYNSFLLCGEYLRSYDLVKESTIDPSHLINILEEFIDAFSTDVVIKKRFSSDDVQHFISKLKGSSLPEQRKVMYYIYHLMAAYPVWASETLRDSVFNPKEKKKIEKSIRSYLPMIIGLGYQPFHIYKFTKKYFQDKTIDDFQCFESFLNHFDGTDIEYIVYFAVKKKVKTFKSILKKRLSISFIQDEFSKKLQFDHRKYICISMHSNALDPNGAALKAYTFFNIFMRYYKFLGNREEDWCWNLALVKDPDGIIDYPHLKPNRYFVSRDYDDQTLGKNSERIISKLLENSAGNDFFTIDKIISTHNTALESHDARNAFLNLWSIIEIIGVYDHTDSKIKEILRSVIPVLKRNYVNCVIEELHDYLKANIDQKDYNRVLSSMKLNGSEEFKISCLLILPEYEQSRKETYQCLEHYPLIRSRISQLNEDVFKTKRKFIVELQRYEQRLTWHIQRLYRVRNAIIHSGDTDDNLKALVEHLHSYVDEIIFEIIDRLTQDNSLGSISNVLMDAQVFIENLEKDWGKKNDPFTLADVQKMFS
ncbi:MAG: hypothetical protein K6G45_02195 [Lachnospiraceae bacterium]|nr:hypothetical protein [Lachnospiraceae bacterium]